MRGLIFKVVPDETMRGLELRNRSVDIVVNDLSPDLVHGLEQNRALAVMTAPGTDYAYIGFNLRDPLLRDARVRWAIGYAVDTAGHRRAPAPRPRPAGHRHRAVDVLGLRRATCRRFTHDPATGAPAAGRGRISGSGRRRPAATVRLTLKTSTAEAYRLQATVIQQNLAEAGIALDVRSYEFATLMADVIRGNVQLYTLQYVGVTDPDMLRRAFHSIAGAAGRLQPRPLRQSEVDALIKRASSVPRRHRAPRALWRGPARVADDVPYVSLWAKTNVAVARADLEGITLSPTAEFSFLRHVRRIR